MFLQQEAGAFGNNIGKEPHNTLNLRKQIINIRRLSAYYYINYFKNIDYFTKNGL